MQLSVIVPVFNEQGNVEPFYQRMTAVLAALPTPLEYEIVYVNNGSADDTFPRLQKLRAADPRVKIITLSRNFGYYGAVMAGLQSREAELYLVIDVDCEDPPELLPVFHDHVREGAQLVYGHRSNRDEPAPVLLMRRLFYALNRWIADSEVVMWMAEFSLMTRQVRDAALVPRTTFPFLRTEMAYVGFKRVGVPYFRAKRTSGKTHYNFFSMTKFAIGGLLASSTFPLRLIFYLALLLAVAFPAVSLGLGLSLDTAARLATILGFYFVLVAVPFIALYLARTYKNGVGRPVYVIDRSATFV